MKYLLILLLSLPLPLRSAARQRTVHVLVALADNKNQGIVKVPAKIGNGQDAANNLYWGCGYGVKTFMQKQPEWQLLHRQAAPAPHIIERLVFKHRKHNVHLVADAYDGAAIATAIAHFLQYAAGQGKTLAQNILAGGNASLVCFIGHNGLMDFNLQQMPEKADAQPRQAAIFACASKPYFYEALRKTGATPLIWTTHLLSPEAYTLDAMLDSWLQNDAPATTHEKVAAAYHQYQHCGMRGARRLFYTGW